MTKLRLFGAAAVVLSSALAGPVMAQQVVSHPGRCVQYDPGGNCLRYAAASRGDRTAYRGERTAYRSDNRNNDTWNNGWRDSRNDNRWQRRDSGFWPGDVAADAAATAGAAVGTAGAIATAPFRGDSYAYDNSDYNNNGWNNTGWNRQTYAQRNGFVCTPGTWFKGADGRQHPCQ
jgi:hypothetical protein